MGKKCAAEIFYIYFLKSNFEIYVSLKLPHRTSKLKEKPSPSKEIFALNPDPKHRLASKRWW
jgi:hypothetical protein